MKMRMKSMREKWIGRVSQTWPGIIMSHHHHHHHHNNNNNNNNNSRGGGGGIGSKKSVSAGSKIFWVGKSRN